MDGSGPPPPLLRIRTCRCGLRRQLHAPTEAPNFASASCEADTLHDHYLASVVAPDALHPIRPGRSGCPSGACPVGDTSLGCLIEAERAYGALRCVAVLVQALPRIRTCTLDHSGTPALTCRLATGRMATTGPSTRTQRFVLWCVRSTDLPAQTRSQAAASALASPVRARSEMILSGREPAAERGRAEVHLGVSGVDGGGRGATSVDIVYLPARS
jgi:hypothetical protein